MELPLSPIIANIFMEGFETRVLDTVKYKLKPWPRYLDDTSIIWTRDEDELQDFSSHPNSIHSKMNFTMKIENRNQLSFLDVLCYSTNLIMKSLV
ncbi:hypothetical protein Trydic_g19096 [Trypoxylus dichotomus]